MRREGTSRPWLALSVFAIFGATTILIVSGLNDVHGVTASVMWRDDKLPDEVLPDGSPTSTPVHAVSIALLPSIGRADAKVTLVVVTDYVCPICESTRPLLQSLRGSYGEDLRIVFKPYAKSPESTPSLTGACAAALQGEFERYDEALWRIGVQAMELYASVKLPDAARPGCASELGGCRDVSRTARDLGLESARFASAIKRCSGVVRANQVELAKLGVDAPAFFINGRLVDPWGVETPGTFHSLIDVELAKARRRIASGASQDRYYQQWVLDVGQTSR
ncbi:MAG: thioredoxin domain-containing protein [Deltaproteobacteria bacterium]|nr:thioredoxin domain-containing protein [Deltaproteobacteria bacterium]